MKMRNQFEVLFLYFVYLIEFQHQYKLDLDKSADYYFKIALMRKPIVDSGIEILHRNSKMILLISWGKWGRTEHFFPRAIFVGLENFLEKLKNPNY
jgi:hypothetical protein